MVIHRKNNICTTLYFALESKTHFNRYVDKILFKFSFIYNISQQAKLETNVPIISHVQVSKNMINVK